MERRLKEEFMGVGASTPERCSCPAFSPRLTLVEGEDVRTGRDFKDDLFCLLLHTDPRGNRARPRWIHTTRSEGKRSRRHSLLVEAQPAQKLGGARAAAVGPVGRSLATPSSPPWQPSYNRRARRATSRR